MKTITVVSAFELKQAEKKKLEETFNAKHEEKQQYVYETDTSLIGGVLVIDGDIFYDSTIRSQLNSIKKLLV